MIPSRACLLLTQDTVLRSSAYLVLGEGVWTVGSAMSIPVAESWLDSAQPDVFIADLAVPGVRDLLESTSQLAPTCSVLIIARPEQVEMAQEWTGSLVRSYLARPIDPEALRLALDDVFTLPQPVRTDVRLVGERARRI